MTLVLCVSCEDVISVPDISEDSVIVIAPVDGAVLDEGDITFTWEELEFAEEYQLQIATSDFMSANQIVLDTIVGDSTQVTRNLTQNLLPNTYQWRIRGLNEAFASSYTTANLEIVDTIIDTDLSNELVPILAPADGVEVIEGAINFNWDVVPNATAYTIQIATPDFENAVQVITDTTVTANFFSIDLVEGNYEWRVKAVNDDSSSPFSTHSLTVLTDTVELSDQTIVLIAPDDNFETSNTDITFSWEGIEEATIYRIRISNTTDGSLFTEQTTTPSEIMITLETGTFEWSVRGENDTQITAYTTRTITIL